MRGMKYPKMILFDYGRTLAYEPGWDSLRGNAALLRYAVKNDGGDTAEDVGRVAKRIDAYVKDIRNGGYEITGGQFNRLLYEYLGIAFSLTPLEQETVFWDAASAGEAMPGAAEMLACIKAKGIRSAVVSNILWSGEALRKRLDRLLPGNSFEFILASSDYMLRKPQPMLFELALRKAGLTASEVWFCGDNPQADIEGAAAAGLFPVWCDSDVDDREGGDKPAPRCACLHIRRWDELTARL